MSRIQSIDVFRLLSIVAVIALHTTPFFFKNNNGLYPYLSLFVDNMARFAVPFFFIISGYFWGNKIRSEDPIIVPSLITAKRIGLIFLFWCFIYILPLNFYAFYRIGLFGPVQVALWHISDLAKDPMALVLKGTSGHLWFFLSLIWALIINVSFIHFKRVKALIIFSISLYLLGVCGRSYSDTPIGIAIGFDTRFGPFFSSLPFTSGYLLSGIKPKLNWVYLGSVVFIAGCLLHFFETFLLLRYFNTWPYHDYVVGTYFMGLGIAVLALSNHPRLRFKKLSYLGRYTLGIYGVHMLFVNNFVKLDMIFVENPIWEIGYVLLVLSLSIATVLLMSKYRFTKNFVL